MDSQITETYRGWNISVKIKEKKLCSRFSFEITDPFGRSQYVSLGGENQQRAIERAREMIDMELAMLEEK